MDHTGCLLKPWVSTQRRYYKSESLKQERVKALAELDFWTWELRDYKPKPYSYYFNQLKKHMGEGNVPKHSSKLGSWYQKQKSLYRMGQLSLDRVKLFQKEGISLKVASIPTWEEWYTSLKSSSELPPQSTALGNWCYKQKKKYEAGKLFKEKVNLLNQLDFWTWETKESGLSWDESFRTFKVFLKEYKRFPKRREKLGGWFFGQRDRIKKGKISQKQYLKLIKIEGWQWFKPS